MSVPRRMLTACIVMAIALMLGGTSVFAKGHDDATPVNGTSSGTSTLTNPSTCNPPSGNPALFICNFDVMGTYSGTPIGTGTYSGTITLDYHSYTATNHCATATGTITFKNADGNQLVTMLGPGSQVCETAVATVHSSHLVLKITGGTGVFKHASGTIISNGTTTDTGPGTHADSATLTGSITLHGNHGEGNDDGEGGGNDGGHHDGGNHEGGDD